MPLVLALAIGPGILIVMEMDGSGLGPREHTLGSSSTASTHRKKRIDASTHRKKRIDPFVTLSLLVSEKLVLKSESSMKFAVDL